MLFNDGFETFFSNIQVGNLQEVEKSIDAIAKKLDNEYYKEQGCSEGLDEDHLFVVGSVGRKTAIKGSDGRSDIDAIYNLPLGVYRRFDGYRGNGQSALIQDLKNVLLERYPRTEIRGDGQVVDIMFDKYTIELVPGFKESNGKFRYPDTHDGGSWQFSDPFSEQQACERADRQSEGVYRRLCQGLRSWRNANCFTMKGILIDALVYEFCTSGYIEMEGAVADYFQIFKKLFVFLKNQNPDTPLWLAPGSGEPIENSGHEASFIAKAEKAHMLFSNALSRRKVLREVFGKDFPLEDVQEKSRTNGGMVKGALQHNGAGETTEQFIEELIPVSLQYMLKIDCRVTQDGFRPFWLLDFLSSGKKYLQKKKQLEFKFDTDCPEPYQVWWKIRNVGVEAQRRNMIRGQILKTDEKRHREHTDFDGPHFVECYLVRDGVCVARDHILVPIGRYQ